MLSNEERDKLEKACEQAKQLLREAVQPIADVHPELSFHIEPSIEIEPTEPREVVA